MDTDMDANEAPMADAALIDQNIDDLFGEAADSLAVDALGAALSPVSLPPALVLRMQEKQNRGCCTKLAWSNTGSIAQITDRGRKIEFRCMLRDSKTGDWVLSEPSKTPILAPEGTTFEHIQFSVVGIDLAVADNHGHVRVYTLVTALGNMLPAPSSLRHDELGRGELGVAVALHWLPTSPSTYKAPYITPATKLGDKWVTELKSRDPSEQTVHHPADGKQALLHVSRGAKLTLMFQNEGVWHATSIDLETAGSSCQLLSHAAMGDNGDHLLLVTHDIGKRFRLYRIAINWNATQHTRPSGPPYITVAPALEIARLTMLDHIAAQHADLASLSDLRLVSSVPTNVASTDPSSLPTVVAVFTRVFLPVDPTQQHQEAFSIIARWQVESAAPVLHESFAKLKQGGAIAPQPAVTTLRRQEDNITSKVVLSVEPQYHNTTLALCASDGTIEFRDRLTMASIEPYGDTTTVSSLPQAGFEHVMGDYHSHIAMSPDGSTLAMIQADDTVTYKMMKLRYSWHPLEDGMSDTQGLVEAAVICLARQYAILCCCSAANDDTLALLPPDLSPKLRASFVREAIRMTNRQLELATWDWAKQQQFAIRESVLRLVISGQYVISRSTGPGKYGFVYLNARFACTALAQTLQRVDPLLQAGFLNSLRGVAKWCCDLINWILDSLISFKRAAEAAAKVASDRPPHQAFLEIAIKQENPVLNILFATYTRVFLRFMSNALSRYYNSTRQALPNVRSIVERQQIEETLAYLASLPFKPTAFDSLMTNVDESIRNVYATPSISSERRVEIELTVMSESTIPDELHPVVQNLIENILPKLMDHIDPAALYFHDTSWLGIEPMSVESLDIIRKLPITKGARLRVCRRCGARMEDVEHEKFRELSPWIVHAQRTCICGNYWIMQD